MADAGALRSEPWERLEGLERALPAWEELVAAAPATSLCNLPGWAFDHARAYASPASVFGWTLRGEDGAVVAVLPLRKEPARGRFALGRALLVQDGTFDSDYLELPIRRGHESAVLAELVRLLRARRGIEAVVLSCVPAEAPQLPALRELFARRGLPARERPAAACAAELPDTFEAYLSKLKSRMRSKVRASLRASEEQGGAFAWCHEAERLDEHLAGLYRLHAMRWSEVGERGSFDDAGRRRFYALLVPRLLREGALRFARLEQRGEPVAYQIGALAGGTYYQLQEGYHTSFADARVGTALRALFVQRLIGEGVRRYDFMAGISRHKTDWGATPRPCTTIAFPLPRLRAKLAYHARALADRWNARRAGAKAARGPADETAEEE